MASKCWLGIGYNLNLHFSYLSKPNTRFIEVHNYRPKPLVSVFSFVFGLPIKAENRWPSRASVGGTQLLTYSILEISVCNALQPTLANVVLSRQKITCSFLEFGVSRYERSKNQQYRTCDAMESVKGISRMRYRFTSNLFNNTVGYHE